MDSEKQHLESCLSHQDNFCLANKGLQPGSPKHTSLQPHMPWTREKESHRPSGFTATLLQYIDFMHYRHLPSPQHSSHKHHAQSHPSCHSSKPQSPGGCSMHSCSCAGREAPVNTTLVWHRDALGPQSSWGKTQTSPLPQPGYTGLAHLPRPSLTVSHLSSSWRKITGPLLETWEALSCRGC